MCRQHLRSFSDGARVRIQPFRASAFPVVRDFAVDRSAMDRMVATGGFVSADAGTTPDEDTRQIPIDMAERALDFSACIGWGVCIAACPNGSSHLFTGSLATHLATLFKGKFERGRLARGVAEPAEEEFGPCSVYGECAEVCPAGIRSQPSAP